MGFWFNLFLQMIFLFKDFFFEYVDFLVLLWNFKETGLD